MPGKYHAFVEDAVELVAQRVSASMTITLRNRAREAGWQGAAGAVRVYDRNGVHAITSADRQVTPEQLEDLEYGTAEEPPRPALDYMNSQEGKEQMRREAIAAMGPFVEQINRMFK